MSLKFGKWSVSGCLLLLFGVGANVCTADDGANDPRNSLVVIHNANNRKGYSEYCIGVLTGEREVMTPAPCADTHFSTLTVCKDMSSCVQAVDDLEERQGVSLAYESKGFEAKDDDIRVVKLKLEESLSGKRSVRIAPVSDVCGSSMSCFFLIKARQELDWHSRTMEADCSLETIASEFNVIYSNEFADPEGYTVIMGAALFNKKGELAGMSYDKRMIYHLFEKERFRCAYAAYVTIAFKYAGF